MLIVDVFRELLNYRGQTDPYTLAITQEIRAEYRVNLHETRVLIRGEIPLIDAIIRHTLSSRLEKATISLRLVQASGTNFSGKVSA